MGGVVAASREATIALAHELKGVAPHHAHMFMPDKLNQRLAVQVLLNPKTMAAVPAKTKGLHKMLPLTTSLGATAHISVSDDDTELEMCKGTLTSGRDCITVIAAAKVLYGMGNGPSAEKSAECEKLLSKERPELTKAVLDALKKV